MGKAKFQEQLEQIHLAFTEHVEANRGQAMDVQSAATGEAWLAVDALDRGLVDDLMTSDEYLRAQMSHRDVIAVEPKKQSKSFLDAVRGAADQANGAMHSIAAHLLGYDGSVQTVLDASTQSAKVTFEESNALR